MLKYWLSFIFFLPLTQFIILLCIFNQCFISLHYFSYFIIVLVLFTVCKTVQKYTTLWGWSWLYSTPNLFPRAIENYSPVSTHHSLHYFLYKNTGIWKAMYNQNLHPCVCAHTCTHTNWFWWILRFIFSHCNIKITTSDWVHRAQV